VNARAALQRPFLRDWVDFPLNSILRVEHSPRLHQAELDAMAAYQAVRSGEHAGDGGVTDEDLGEEFTFEASSAGVSFLNGKILQPTGSSSSSSSSSSPSASDAASAQQHADGWESPEEQRESMATKNTRRRQHLGEIETREEATSRRELEQQQQQQRIDELKAPKRVLRERQRENALQLRRGQKLALVHKRKLKEQECERRRREKRHSQKQKKRELRSLEKRLRKEDSGSDQHEDGIDDEDDDEEEDEEYNHAADEDDNEDEDENEDDHDNEDEDENASIGRNGSSKRSSSTSSKRERSVSSGAHQASSLRLTAERRRDQSTSPSTTISSSGRRRESAPAPLLSQGASETRSERAIVSSLLLRQVDISCPICTRKMRHTEVCARDYLSKVFSHPEPAILVSFISDYPFYQSLFSNNRFLTGAQSLNNLLNGGYTLLNLSLSLAPDADASLVLNLARCSPADSPAACFQVVSNRRRGSKRRYMVLFKDIHNKGTPLLDPRSLVYSSLGYIPPELNSDADFTEGALFPPATSLSRSGRRSSTHTSKRLSHSSSSAAANSSTSTSSTTSSTTTTKLGTQQAPIAQLERARAELLLPATQVVFSPTELQVVRVPMPSAAALAKLPAPPSPTAQPRFRRCDVLDQIRVVFVATTSAIKKQAVFSACAPVFAECGKFPSMIPLADIQSRVPEQPHGFSETEIGCTNRLRQAVEVVQQQQRYGRSPLQQNELAVVIAIENGIWQQPEVQHEWDKFANVTANYYDAAVVQLAIVDANTVIVHQNQVVSTAIPVPEWVIGQWKKECDQHANDPDWVMPTIGDVFHSVRGGDVKDPHSTILGGRMGRSRILQQAVECLLGSSLDQLCYS